MVRLVYESLADYLVRKRNYDGLLLDDFTTDEMQLLSRHQIVDFDNLNVKLSLNNISRSWRTWHEKLDLFTYQDWSGLSIRTPVHAPLVEFA